MWKQLSEPNYGINKLYLELLRSGNPFSISLGSSVFVLLKSHKKDLANGKSPADGRARGRYIPKKHTEKYN